MQTPVAFDASQLQGLGIKPMVSLLAHWRAAAWAFGLVVLLGIPVVWVKGRPHYLATATVQVAPRYMKNIKDDNELDFQSNSQYRQFVEHQARSVARFDILSRTLSVLGDKASILRLPGESERRSIERLQERLVVLPVPDTYLMQIALESDSKEGIADIVNTVVEIYLLRMKEEQMYGSEERVKNLELRAKEILAQVMLKTQRRTTIALELGVTTFNDGDGNPYDKLLLSTRATLAEARNIRMAAEAKMEAFIASGETDISTRSINESILSDPGLNSFKASLNTRRASLLSTVSGLSVEHPANIAAHQELKEIEREIQIQTTSLTKDINKSLLSRFQMTRDQARRYEQGLEQILQGQEKSSARFAVLFNEALTLSSEIEQHNKEIDTFRERINFFAAERSALGFVRLVTPALPPETPFGPGRKKLAMLLLLAALLAGGLIPILIDLADRRIRTVNDAERTLGLPSLGWLIEQDNAASKMFAQDQLRRIAGGLIREQASHDTRVFALCGVKPGAGCSNLSLDLALALNALGYPTLVVEANAFRPDPRFASDKPGLSQCLLDQARPSECISAADQGLPARVSVGTASEVVHLDRLDRLPETIQQWSGQYRFILVDMPPLLLSADAEIMINRLGQILLVVEAGGISRGELSRAGRLLEKTATHAVGIIVNRIKPLEGGGYIHQLLIEFLTQRKFSQFEAPLSKPQQLRGWFIEKFQTVTNRIRQRSKKLFTPSGQGDSK